MGARSTSKQGRGIASNLDRPRDRTSTVWRASDEALLAGLAAGDADAAVAFVRRYQRRVFGLAMTLLGDRDRADDVAQEAMVRAWRHADAYDARRGSVTTWLLTITRNVAVDALRASRSTPVDDERLDALLPASRDVAPEHAIAADELRRVASALEALPVEQRRALLLMRLRGFTAADVAAHDGIPLGTAKTRVRTAMLRLREDLVDEPVRRDDTP
jgi:RNA polymerase sigma factor (sigma-70 family)